MSLERTGAELLSTDTEVQHPKGNSMKSKQVFAAAAALVLAGTMAACSSEGPSEGGGGGDSAACTNVIPKPDLPVVTVWAWYPNSETVADNFN